VAAAKSRFAAVYHKNMQDGTQPPDKHNFDSNIPGVTTGRGNDCYYVHSTDNDRGQQIQDPLFAGQKLRPWPYQQPPSHFPRQATPAEVYAPQAVARPAPAGGAAPALAARTRVIPHEALIAVVAPSNHGREGHDWVEVHAENFEISTDSLLQACEKAEELDYAFALSMQGLRGTNLAAVWLCIDPEYDVTDRSAVLAQFVKMYMEKFYGQVSVTGPTDVEEVVHEALWMHEEFCKGWISRHHKTLSAEVTAASEALVGLFYDNLRAYMRLTISQQQLSRYLRRSGSYCTEFAHCLYHYMTSLEKGRGNRNPSYKAMDKEQAMYIMAMKSMAQLLQSHLQDILTTFQGLQDTDLLFDLRFIDWHHISAQMPQYHKEFEGYANNFNLYHSRAGGRMPSRHGSRAGAR
jgi:hypothetical protein